MQNHIIRATRIALLAMLGALVFETTKQTISSHIPLWGSHIHTILFVAISAFVVSIAVLRREAEAEDVLNDGKQLLQSVLKSGLDGFYLVDTQGRLLQVNDAYCTMSGYTREELLQMRVADVECAESEQDVAAHIELIIRQGTDRFESRHRRKNGQIISVETSVNFQSFGGGRFFCFLRDITERKIAEQTLRDSEERFRRVVEGAPIGMYIQTDGLLRYLNPAALSMFGAESIEQLVGQSYLDRVHPDSRDAVIDRARIVRQEQKAVPLLEEQHLRMDGTAFDIEANAIPFVYGGNHGAVVFFRDITQRKRKEVERHTLEQQLRQAQKMEAVGRLAGGIAHDFNNLLMVIQSYTEMLQDSLPAHDTLRRNTQEIMKAADRAASLTRQMLAFSRKQILSPVVLDLNAVIDETAKMLKRLIGEDIEFRVSLGGVTLGDRGRLGSDGSGSDEPLRECPRCHASRRHAHDRDRKCHGGGRKYWRAPSTYAPGIM